MVTRTSQSYVTPPNLAMAMHELVQGHRLTPTQRRIAQWLAKNAAQAAHSSSVELAELANVSQPSVTRFAVTLGYSGYPALRRKIQELLTRTEDYQGLDSSARNEWAEAVAVESANLGHLAAILDDVAPIEQAGSTLIASRPLVVIGLRAACGLATYFSYFAAKFHPDVRLYIDGGTHLIDKIDQAKSAGADAALIFVMPRCPRESVDTVRQAREAGLEVVLVTDSPLSPAAEQAHHVLHAPVGSELVFDSHAAPMVLTMVLLQAMCDARPAESQSRLEDFENYAIEHRLFA